MRGCSECRFFQPERVTSPFTGREEIALLCVAGPGDSCPVSEAPEVVVPCHRCGGECDGHGVIDGLPVCPKCDSL